MNSFLYKADSKELWLVMPEPQLRDFRMMLEYGMGTDSPYQKAKKAYNSRLHYTCSPELAAILTEGQEVNENEFDKGECTASMKCTYNNILVCHDNGCQNPIAIPLPDLFEGLNPDILCQPLTDQTKQVEQPAKNEPTPELLETVKIDLFYRDFGVLNEYLASIGEKKIEAAPKGDDVIRKEEIQRLLWDNGCLAKDLAKMTDAVYEYASQFQSAPQAVKWVQADLQSELNLMYSWIDKVKEDNTPAAVGAAKIRIGNAMKRLFEGSTDKNQTK